MADFGDPPTPMALKRQLSVTSAMREQMLHDFSTKLCTEKKDLTFEEVGWFNTPPRGPPFHARRKKKKRGTLHGVRLPPPRTSCVPLEPPSFFPPRILQGWAMLRDNGIIILFDFLLSEKNNGETKPFGNRGYSALYTIGFTLGSQAFRPDDSAVLYTNIRAEIERYLTDSVVAPLLDASLVGLPMIQKFSKAWGDAKTMTRWIAMLFHHVDTGYVYNSNSATLSGLGMSLFRKIGFFQTCDRVRSGVLDLIDQERYGAAVDEAEIRNCVEVFKVMGSCSPEACHELKDVPTLLKQTIDLSIYHEHFEASFLARTTAFYKAKAESWREEPVSNYLKLVERALASEKARADRYLHASTERPLRLATVGRAGRLGVLCDFRSIHAWK